MSFRSVMVAGALGGTIDYIRSGGFGINCVGNSDGCLDMDGSSGNAGRITSRQVFAFAVGVEYFIDVALSGNQRGGASDTVIVGLVEATSGAELSASFGPLAANAPFNVFTANFFGVSVPGSWRLFVEGVGGDNIGAILDNYVLRDDQGVPVPQPATLVLSGLALLGVGVARRRR